MTVRFRDVVVEIARITCPVSARVVGCSQQKENDIMWETPEYTVIEVCAEATGYFYRR
ncbi:hypothetical protein [Amycolatopsis sp. NBC_01480]|uniref:hypothetical protein n=1 Tax=Amycolatopsis sp. NBC_01480 TaxID=2903562 RepID=UPI002E29826D|nr:hypothetical protein [Amycolatopsis sp. NBC_01480]